jgi:N-acetylglutamate synthase-like GNAT family acetyltransferase
MSDFRIRGAARGDVAALAHLMSDLGYPTSPGEMRHRLEDISADPSYCALVAERDGRVLGMVGLHGVRYTVRTRPHAYGYDRPLANAG